MALHVRLRLRHKIVLACFFLTIILLAGSYFINQLSLTQAANRGRFLEKHMLRFLNYEARLGDNLAATLQIVMASNRRALLQALRDRGAAAQPTGARQPAAARQPAVAPAEHKTRVRDRLRRLLLAPLELHLKPDFVAVVDPSGKVLVKGTGTTLAEGEPARMRLFTDVLQGSVVGRFPLEQLHRSNGELLVQRGRVYQAVGVPLRDERGAVVAAVVIGVGIERYFRDYQTQSDSREAKQHRLTFLRQRKVLASVLPTSEWGPLAAQLQKATAQMSSTPPDRWTVDHGGRKRWDFDMVPITGYAGSVHGEVGRLYIMRVRKQDNLESMIRDNMVLFIVGGLLTLLVGWALSWLITRPLERFIAATKDIAAGTGDLSRRIHSPGGDEFAQLAENINHIFSNLQALAGDVQRAGLQVGTSSVQISSSSRQMLDGAKDQAVRVESSTAAVTELSASIQQVAENAMEATRRAEQSGTAVSDTIERMTAIRLRVEETATKIKALGQSIKRIGNIVEVIRQISEQTSLLALNASIEAAHAGEQGRGFAVVADEVSSLARRVGQSAKDIEDLIATITDQTSDAVQSMEVGNQVVEEGTSLVTVTLDDLRKIIEVIEDTARSVQEQAVVSDDIARNMDAVREIAHRVVSSSEEAVAQGEELHQLAGRLESSVAGFSVGDATSASTASSSSAAAAAALPAHDPGHER
jgi:methyl-accepting chemotaxis protein